LPEPFHKRQIGHFYKADPEYGRGVARHMGIAIDEEAPQLRAAE
jgi:hypothetical protein